MFDKGLYFINSIYTYLLYTTSETPFSILKQSWRGATEKTQTINILGLPQLAYVLDIAGMIGAVIVIISSLLTLVLVNYPKTVAQTKTKIVHALLVVALIGALPFLADVVYTVIYNAVIRN